MIVNLKRSELSRIILDENSRIKDAINIKKNTF